MELLTTNVATRCHVLSRVTCHAAQSRGRVVKSIVLIMRLHLRNVNTNYLLRDAELVTVTQCDEDIYLQGLCRVDTVSILSIYSIYPGYWGHVIVTDIVIP